MSVSLLGELNRRNVFKVGTAYLVLAWIVIQVTDSAVPALNLPIWVNALVFYFGLIGFPFALFFAWAFEITPEGIKKESEINRDDSIAHVTGRKLDFIIIGMLIFALGYFIWESRYANKENTNTAISQEIQTQELVTPKIESPNLGSSIAVLPFVNMSTDKEQEYFADGISEEILNVLAQIPNLKVTSRSSSFSFKGKEIIISEVAKKLGVKNILEGSVRRSGEKVRITAQLIEAETDQHLWSQTYDREMVDIFKVQDEISTAIVASLRDKLGLETEVINRDMSNVNLDAHSEYLKGRYLIERRTNKDVKVALEHFTNATQLDPDYAPAWMGVAWSYVFLNENTYGDIESEIAINEAQRAINKSLELDSGFVESHAIHALVLSQQGKHNESEASLHKALELNPNYANAYTWLGDKVNHSTTWLDDHDPSEFLSINQKALSLNPLSVIVNTNYAESLTMFGRTDEAMTIAQQVKTIEPLNPLADFTEFSVHLYNYDYALAAYSTQHAIELNPELTRIKFNLINLLNKLGIENREGILFNTNADVYIPLFKNNPIEHLKQVQAKYPRSEKDSSGIRIRARAEATLGNYQQALMYFSKDFVCEICDVRIYSYQQIGEIETANKLIEKRIKHYNKAFQAGVKFWSFAPNNYSNELNMGIVAMNNAYLQGDMQSTVLLLQEELNKGYIIGQKYKNHPMYKKLRSNEKWIEFIDQSKQNATQQRNIYLQLEAKNLFGYTQ